MKPFNLEDYNQGSEVVTGDGQAVKILSACAEGDYPVVGQYLGCGSVDTFTARGVDDLDYPEDTHNNLFFKTKKEVRYVAVLEGAVQTAMFKTEEACKVHYNPDQLDTVAQLTWEV